MAIQNSYPALRPSLLLDFANSRQLDPRITFTRSTTATYYDGVTTAKAEENLLTYSQEFDNAVWSKTASTVTANSTTAPDGTSTADTLTETATTNYHSTYQTNISLAATSYTFSCFAKPNGRNEITLVMLSGSDIAYATYNVSTGSITVAATTSGSFSSASTTITASANGFYRVTLTATAPSTSTATLAIELYNAARTYAGNGTSGVYLWGAQLEQRSSATAYTATTTQAITNYIPKLLTAGANQPRFDHNPTTGESLGFLIEEQRTNQMPNSNVNSGGVYQGTNTASAAVSPIGTITANRFVPNSGTSPGASAAILLSSGTTGAGQRVYSVYVKNSGLDDIRLYDNDASVYCSFNLTTGAYYNLGGTAAGSINCGNGWWRVWMTGTSAVTTSYFQIYSASTGDGFNGWLWFGSQIENSSFPTSYIPTAGSTATRTADTWVIPNTHFTKIYNFAEFSIYLELARNYATATDSTIWQIGTGTGNIQMYQYRNSGYVYLYGARNNHSTLEASISTTTTVLSTAYAKIAGSFKTNNFNLVINSVVLGTDTTGQIPTEVTEFIGGNLPGYYKKIMIYPILVTNAQLQALTS